MDRHQRSQRMTDHCAGVTLLEVLVSALMLTIAIAGILQATVMSLRMAQHTHATLLAVKGAQDYQLETIRSWTFGTLHNKSHQTWNGFPLPASLTQALPGVQGSYFIQNEPPASSYGSGATATMEKVTIRVQWTDATGARSSTVSTLIGSAGLTDPTRVPPQ